MNTSKRKALYIFLSSILGFLLFTMFHRAVIVIYEIFGNFYPTTSWLHLSYKTLALLDFGTFLLALFFGGWYGVWIGLNWYKLIYEDREVKTWFHGFVPHHWRKSRSHSEQLHVVSPLGEKAMKPKTKTVPKKIVVTSSSVSKRPDAFRSFRAEKTVRASMPWDNEDAQLEPRVVKKVAKKRVVKKAASKAVAKKKITA